MAKMVQVKKKIALLHRFQKDRIKETNAAFPYLESKGIDVLTYKTFNRLNSKKKLFKSLLWILYAPCLVIGRGYDVIYCDDSFPFYPALVKLVSPKSKVIIRLGDLHLMYYTKGTVYNLLHRFEKIGWKAANKILVISEAMQKYMESEGFKSHVVLDPIEPENFKPSFKEKSKDKIVMFHGLITRNKNLDLVIEAAKRLKNIFFWIVGDGPDLARLQSIAPKNVVFTGWHEFSLIPAMLNICNIGLALRENSQGNQYVVTSPFLQYGCMGKPCLVTRRKVFKKYKWQFSGVDEMVDKIKDLLKKPQEGKKLRKFILKKHNAKKIGSQIWNHLLA